ncbi:uncharacterized protein LOC123318835 [Coccinella septempunctata]|uniref:uncharacterized protein LOC123318835 n=1 Tax=Coccinella septempunctata TaxID=41139 RepID=UPI001D084B32|nr:uncharacterized protein LOC123318835 [Coccinella septempunctata]
MPRSRTSFIWDYFTKNENGEAQCDTCMKTIAVNGGSTSNLIKHLKCKHKEVLDQSETSKDEYILLQGENYEASYIQADNAKIEEVDQPTHYEIIPAPKPKKPKFSHVESDMRVVKPAWAETVRTVPSRVAVPEDNSLEIFARYMISLMKDIPKKKCEDVQLKIVSLILGAKREDETTEDQSRSMENGHN